MRGVSMPSRTYNILAAGKPILALTESGSEISKVVEEDNVGWTVPANDPEALLLKIFEIYENRDKFGAMSRNARQSALEKYSLEAALIKYKAALK
jgi:glycosyltransferase involved in cell wall biosynthesis